MIFMLSCVIVLKYFWFIHQDQDPQLKCSFIFYTYLFFPFGRVCSDTPSHTAAVIAAIVLLLLLGVCALVYSKCHLNIKLWYKNTYGDYEHNGETHAELTQGCNTAVQTKVLTPPVCCFASLHPQMGSYMMPISPLSTMTTTGSLSTLFSNLTWKIKTGTRCTSMTMISFQALVRLHSYTSGWFSVKQTFSSLSCLASFIYFVFVTISGVIYRSKLLLFNELFF